MKCHNCGAQIPEESVFCGMCGARVEQESTPIETVTEPITEPNPEPIEPVTEPESSPAEPVTEPEPKPIAEPEPTEPVTEPEPSPAEPELEPIAEPEAEPIEPEQVQTDHQQNSGTRTEEFVIDYCPYCGAVLIKGAKFCSNCGNSIVVYEQNMKSRIAGGQKKNVKLIIAAVAAAIVIIFGANFLRDCRSIKGSWAVENTGFGLFDMFSESYLDFDNDGTAMYYSGLFTVRKYNYTDNRFTKTLVLTSAGRGLDTADSRLHVDWIDRYTISIRELDMTLYRINDIPYSYDDDEYDDGDAIQF